MKEALWKHEYIDVNNIRMHYVTQGKGPLVLLIHGFPEFWYSWRHQIPEMAKRFKVVAPDMRGYNQTEKPVGVGQYRLDVLTADVAGLIEALGYDKAVVVAHDWGGAVAWAFAMALPRDGGPPDHHELPALPGLHRALDEEPQTAQAFLLHVPLPDTPAAGGGLPLQ